MNDIKRLNKLSKNFTVLYVEDDKKIQGTMSKYLRKLFKSVNVADDGQSGLELYNKIKPDIIITDLSMPKMNGIEMIKKIRNINLNQTVLITTAHNESIVMLDAIRAGIDGYIIKPFDFEQLNFELYKITYKLQKFKESDLYKNNLENLIDKKSAIVSSLLAFQSENYEKTLYSMVEMIEDRDTYTAGHSKRVATCSKMIAEAMGYSKDDCTKIYQAGMLHDIGKMATPDAVLLNPKTLNDIEYKLIQEHVNVGYKLLKNVPMFESLSEIVYSHHERCDGKGYPRGISGDEITPLARIIMVADAFDAMTTSRIYKGRKTVTEAIKELQDLAGKQFHIEVVKKAITVLKNIVIDENISQLPKTDIEEKRFAYFYKDTLTDVYNKNYLDLLLIKNTYEKTYAYIDTFFINKFSQYNKKYTWAKGDEFLKNFATTLKTSFPNSIIFRIFGDDFVILSKEEIFFEKNKKAVQQNIEKSNLTYRHQCINLFEQEIENSQEIEKL